MYQGVTLAPDSSSGLSAARLVAVNWERAMEPAKGEGGGSEPHLFATNHGSYMVKASNNPQGKRVLVNELVGGLCLQWLGVAHPQTAIVELPEELLKISPQAVFNSGQRLASGPSFGSQYWQSDPQGTVDSSLIVNVADVAGTIAFDTWIHNHDSRQFRVRAAVNDPKKYEFVPVDQGFCFGSPVWTPASLAADVSPALAPAPLPGVGRKEIESFVDRLRQVDELVAEALVGETPDEWLDDPVSERSALAQYLVERAPLAADVLDGAFPP